MAENGFSTKKRIETNDFSAKCILMVRYDAGYSIIYIMASFMYHESGGGQFAFSDSLFRKVLHFNSPAAVLQFSLSDDIMTYISAQRRLQ